MALIATVNPSKIDDKILLPATIDIKSEIVVEEIALYNEIERLSSKYNVSKTEVLAVISCESNFKGDAINYNKNGTIDRSYFQINSVHQNEMERLGLNIKNKWDSLEFGFMLMAKQGLKPWYSSEHCWSSKI